MTAPTSEGGRGRTKVTVNEKQLQRTLSRLGISEARKILRFIQRRAIRGALGGPYSRTNALALSIRTSGPALVPLGGGDVMVFGAVYSRLNYAASVEHGAAIHPIFPKGAPHIYRFGSRRRPQLSFIWRGRRVVTPHVPMSASTIFRSHPGQRGKHFLVKALLEAVVFYRGRLIPGPRTFS